MNVQYRWATYGVGVIGHQLAEAMKALGGSLYSVGNRTHEKAVAFAKEYGIDKVYDDPDEMFSDPEVDIVYISTPHNTHIDILRKALASGKHALCEKAITLNMSELEEAIALADQHEVILSEAMTIYHMPIYKKLSELIDGGSLGKLNVIQMNFGSFKEWNMKNRFFNRNLAGGAMLDIGVYALSFARWFMREAPDQMLTQVRLAPTGVDEQASMLLKNSEGEMASIILSLHSKQPKRGLLSFENAYIEMYEYPRGEKAVITYTEDGHQEAIEAGATSEALMYEVLDMERAVSAKKAGNISDKEIKAITHIDYTKDVMKLMTDARREWGMTYPEEE